MSERGWNGNVCTHNYKHIIRLEILMMCMYGQVSTTGLPLFQASNENVSRSGVGKVSGETMTSLHTHAQVGTMMEVKLGGGGGGGGGCN